MVRSTAVPAVEAQTVKVGYRWLGLVLRPVTKKDGQTHIASSALSIAFGSQFLQKISQQQQPEPEPSTVTNNLSLAAMLGLADANRGFRFHTSKK